ncbi:hypothetical protein CRM22_006429 [Opisthorchis felineus]|uniref:Uncharacterized protein n=1 Tax=Opisthorchis felineus TaxID=147828 RepID=A0A4S2LKX3_OPIFE|nr:hypothetical protein CRM22_006429 [Opisthorchis felineus]
MFSRQVPYAFASSIHVDRHSFASVYLSSWLNAQFHTDRCNYDHGWPPITNAHPNVLVNNGVHSSTNQTVLDAEPSDTDLDPTLVMCSLQHSLESIRKLRDQVEAKKQQLTKIRTLLHQKINSKYVCCPPECTVEQVKKYLEMCTEASHDMVDRQKQLTAKVQTIREQLVACTDHMNTYMSKCSQTAIDKQNDYIQKWNQQRFGWSMGSSADDRITVRIETPSSDTFPGRPFALVRGTHQCDNLEVVCNQHTDVAAIAQCASVALAPGALIAELLSTKYVNQLIRVDILRLQSQYALDWDKEKRQLSLLSGLNGNVLAILSVRTDGNIALTNVQYKPNDEQDNPKTVESANADFMTKLKTFTPPPTNSLDEWISEVHDFCFALSGSLP